MKNTNSSLKETFAKAVLAYNKKDLKAAEVICNKILSINPNHFDSINLLANISVSNSNFKEAKRLLIQAIEIKPKNIRINTTTLMCRHEAYVYRSHHHCPILHR